MYEAVAITVISGIIATIMLTIFAKLGPFLDVDRFRSVGAYIITMIALRIAGFRVPVISDFQLRLFGVPLSDGLGIIMFLVLLAGFIISLLPKKLREIRKEDKQTKDLFFIMTFLLVLPSIDGNIFTLSATNQLIFSNIPIIFILSLTIISSPGSWSVAATIGGIVSFHESLRYVLGAGLIGTLFASIAAAIGQLAPRIISLSIFSHITATAVFISAAVVKYEGKLPLINITLPVILFAVILSAPSELIFIPIFISTTLLILRYHGIMYAVISLIIFSLEAYFYFLYNINTFSALVTFTYGAYFLLLLIEAWRFFIKKYTKEDE